MVQPVVYILASGTRGTLYIGVTSDLARRVEGHRFLREKQLKKWNRLWKIELVEEANPEWRDLSDQAG